MGINKIKYLKMPVSASLYRSGKSMESHKLVFGIGMYALYSGRKSAGIGFHYTTSIYSCNQLVLSCIIRFFETYHL